MVASAAAEKDFTVRPILPPAFVSMTTLKGLRVTIRSVIDMVDLLLQTDEFEFVLTGKFNQDCLEVSDYNYTAAEK